MKYIENKKLIEALKKLGSGELDKLDEKGEALLTVLVNHYKKPEPPDYIQKRATIARQLTEANENHDKYQQLHKETTAVVKKLETKIKEVGDTSPKGLELKGDLRNKKEQAENHFNEAMRYRDEVKRLKKEQKKYKEGDITEGLIEFLEG